MADSTAECSAVLAATNDKLTAVIGEMKAFRTFAGEAAGFVGVLNTGGGMIFLILADIVLQIWYRQQGRSKVGAGGGGQLPLPKSGFDYPAPPWGAILASL